MSTLSEELKRLEGILHQNPETGAKGQDSYLSEYTNRVFGSPFQLLDSVDKRFDDVNKHVGNEFLRNFILNSPILHIRPGMPKYTGGSDPTSLSNNIRNLYMDVTSGNMSFAESLISGLASSTIFNVGKKLQRRMFGFRETYYDYMQHVNYMCRSEAVFLNLVSGSNDDRYPTGTFVSGGDNKFEEFTTLKWENYRMLQSSTTKTPWEYLKTLNEATALNVLGHFAMFPIQGPIELLMGKSLSDTSLANSFFTATETTVTGTIQDKITSVEFMVEPVQFEETLTNNTKNSVIEDAVDGIKNGVGNEIAFITNSNADSGMLEGVLDFLGSTTEGIATSLAGITQGATGGFMTNLFTGAIQSVKGQKMIYPKIYESSNSESNYQFTVTLTTPYGDVYNYYMNIVVPLMHLVALAAPRLVSSNSVASPYLVQAYIPGQCTVHLGIISNMVISKNPDGNHVSVNGFPLTVKVTFTITELYNSMSISPGNDPSSFLFNETLNDYMANLAGLIPSIDTYTKQRKVMLQNLATYIQNGEFVNDIAGAIVDKIEDVANPFLGR